MPITQNDSLMVKNSKGDDEYSLDRKPATLARRTFHTATFKLIKTGNKNPLNRTFNQIKTSDDLDVIFATSVNGYNILHDAIRLPCIMTKSKNSLIKSALDNYKIVRSRILDSLGKFQEEQRFSELLLGKAENAISILSSAISSGEPHLVIEVYNDIERHCGFSELKKELMHYEETRGRNFSIVEMAICLSNKPIGQDVYTIENLQILKFLIDKLKDISPLYADDFILTAFRKSSWLPSRMGTVEQYLEHYEQSVKRYDSRTKEMDSLALSCDDKTGTNNNIGYVARHQKRIKTEMETATKPKATASKCTSPSFFSSKKNETHKHKKPNRFQRAAQANKSNTKQSSEPRKSELDKILDELVEIHGPKR